MRPDWPGQTFASFANQIANERGGIDRYAPWPNGTSIPHALEVTGLHGAGWDSL